jgi:hypothetical protein
MWTDRQTRPMLYADVDAALETNRAFVEAVAGARQRETSFRSTYDQLRHVLEVGNTNLPIEAAPLPPDLPWGEEKVRELAMQLRLSAYLGADVAALLHHFEEDERTLARAEDAVRHLDAQPELRIAAKAVVDVGRLFAWVDSVRDRFYGYPVVYELLGGHLEARVSQRDLTAELPSSVRGFFQAETAMVDVSSLLDDDLDPETLKDPNVVVKLVGMPPLTLELGLDLVSLVDPALGGDLMDRMANLRLKLAVETGFVMPGLHIQDNPDLRPNTYRVLVRGVPVAEGELLMGFSLAIEQAVTDTSGEELVGFPTSEAAFGRQAVWLVGAEAERARELGYLLLDTPMVLLQHVEETLRRHAGEILSIDDLQIMLDELAKKMPRAVEAVLPRKLELAEYHLLLKNLLRERVAIRDQATVLEAVAHAVKLGPDGTPQRLDADTLLEQVRLGLSRQLCAALAFDDVISVLTLDPDAEEILLDYLDDPSSGPGLRLPMPLQSQLDKRLLGACERSGAEVLLVSARLRPHMKRLTQRNLPRLTVLSHAEIHPDYHAEEVDSISLVEN